jgi:hypothetical protein
MTEQENTGPIELAKARKTGQGRRGSKRWDVEAVAHHLRTEVMEIADADYGLGQRFLIGIDAPVASLELYPDSGNGRLITPELKLELHRLSTPKVPDRRGQAGRDPAAAVDAGWFAAAGPGPKPADAAPPARSDRCPHDRRHDRLTREATASPNTAGIRWRAAPPKERRSNPLPWWQWNPHGRCFASAPSHCPSAPPVRTVNQSSVGSVVCTKGGRRDSPDERCLSCAHNI